MIAPPSSRATRSPEDWLMFGLFFLALAFHLWAVFQGWRHVDLAGHEFRQTQTAISAFFIQQENNFALAYPTPVLGAPWSIPFEFPLYQWTVVVVSNVTGLPIAPAARLVSIACFYLTLVPLFLLLRRTGFDRNSAVLPLLFVLTSPLYIFYARAVLIESMALLFAAWYLAALVRCGESQHRGWGAVAILAGTGAGLVKVTTFVAWLVPAFFCCVAWLWRARPAVHGGNRAPATRLFLWLATLHAIPFLITWAWLRYSDAVKSLNPSAAAFTSDKLKGFNFGYGTRMLAKTWADWWTQISQNLAGPAVLAFGFLVILFFAGRWRRLCLGSLGIFLAALLTFPLLYAIHSYYFYATGVFLLGAIGVAFAGLRERPRWRLAASVLALACCSLQARQFLVDFAPIQRTPGNGGGLADALRTLTSPEESVIIAGDDWNSTIPYYAQRRALMIRNDLPSRPDYLRAAFPLMQRENVAALVLIESQLDNQVLLQTALRSFDLDPEPVFGWQHLGRRARVYLHRDAVPEALSVFTRRTFHEVTLLRTSSAAIDPLRGREMSFDQLLPRQRRHFRLISPKPVRFFSTFGIYLIDEDKPGKERFAANADTTLWFDLPAGRHVVHTDLVLPDTAWAEVPGGGSDGVEFVIAAAHADGRRDVLQRRYFDPRSNPADRGIHPISWTVELPAGAQLELNVNGGPAGSIAYDWASLGSITID